MRGAQELEPRWGQENGATTDAWMTSRYFTTFVTKCQLLQRGSSDEGPTAELSDVADHLVIQTGNCHDYVVEYALSGTPLDVSDVSTGLVDGTSTCTLELPSDI